MERFSRSNDRDEKIDNALAATQKLLEFVGDASDVIPVPGLSTAVEVLKSIIEAIQVGSVQCFPVQRSKLTISQKTRGNDKSKAALLEKIGSLTGAIQSACSMPQGNMSQLGDEQGREVKQQMGESRDLQNVLSELIGSVDFAIVTKYTNNNGHLFSTLNGVKEKIEKISKHGFVSHLLKSSSDKEALESCQTNINEFHM